MKRIFTILSVFTKKITILNNINIKLKREIDGKINLYSRCNDWSFKKFATIDEDEIGDLLKKV